MPFVAKWMDLEIVIIIAIEVRQRTANIWCALTCGIELICKTEIESKNKLTGRINSEFGTIHTPICGVDNQ